MKTAKDYPERDHSGKPNMTAASISIPKEILEKIDQIAKREDRTRSAQLVRFVREAIAEYETTNKGNA